MPTVYNFLEKVSWKSFLICLCFILSGFIQIKNEQKNYSFLTYLIFFQRYTNDNLILEE